MKPIENIEIPYFEDGEQKTEKIVIKFVSNRIVRDFNEVMSVSNKVKDSWDDMQVILTDNARLKMLKEKGYKDIVKENDAKYAGLLKIIEAVKGTDFFNQRFELVKRLLSDNGYKDHANFMSFEFWDEHVDPDVMITMLSRAVYKDIIEYNKTRKK